MSNCRAILLALLFGLNASTLLFHSNLGSIATAQDNTKQLFSHLSPALYQIRIIDISSGQKSSIGTGFQISDDNLIVSNYHVIAKKALEPNNFIIQYENSIGYIGELELVSVDVVNDLALLKRTATSVDNEQSTVNPLRFLKLADSDPVNGEEVYSLGNPHDLGMIISPGTYNGIKKDSFYNRVHFTGSINSGMSGGPVVNAQEQVVGINVATSGNSIGFLVPRIKLIELLESRRVDSTLSIRQQIHQDLFNNQKQLISELVTNQWQQQTLGGASVPVDFSSAMKCWGRSNADDKDTLFDMASARCQMQENIYLSHQFRTGHINVEYYWYDGNDLSSAHFYQLFERFYQGAGPDNRATKKDVESFQCHDDIVSHDNETITHKVSLCTRAYKEYPGLFDALYMAATIDGDNHGLVSHFTLAGVSQESILAFSQKFMAAIEWQ